MDCKKIIQEYLICMSKKPIPQNKETKCKEQFYKAMDCIGN